MKYVWCLAVLAFLFVTPEPAYAGGDVVYVESRVGMQTANLRTGVRFVDKYTKSRFVFGKCRTGYRCIVVRIDRNRQKGTAWAAWSDAARSRVTVSVNPGRGSAYMSRLFAHEVAHGMFVGHSKYRTNLMYPTLHTANGKLVAWRFTEAQKQTLGRH